MNTDKSIPHNLKPNFKLSFLHPKYFLTWLGMGLIYLCKFLPYKVIILLGRILGSLLYGVSPHRKQIAKTNIELCFPYKNEQEVLYLLKEHFKNIGIGIFELAIAWWSSKKAIKNLKVCTKNLEVLKNIHKDH